MFGKQRVAGIHDGDRGDSTGKFGIHLTPLRGGFERVAFGDQFQEVLGARLLPIQPLHALLFSVIDLYGLGCTKPAM